MDDFLRTNVVIGISALVVTYLAFERMLPSRRTQSLPPGPARWPIVGNALQVPQNHTWLTFSKWAKEYGNIVHLDVIGQPFIVLNSARVARDLLDKRSLIYSNRPHMVMACELVGYDRTFVLAQYGNDWRKQRRLIAQDFGQSTVPQYYRLQETEARKLVLSVLDDPSSLESQTKLRIGTVIIRVTYGYYINSSDDPFLTMPLTAMDNFSQATAPGTWLVDIVPLLKHMPTWLPGSGFLETAKKWRQLVYDTSWNAYLWSRAGLETGSALKPNLCGNVVSEAGDHLTKEEEHVLVWAASAVMGGGMDTNMSTILSFFLAMVLHPDIQAKARAEIDSVIGRDVLPSVADKASLPYVRSVITEVFRWNPAVPLGIPHSSNQADIYEGYNIPKDSLVVANVWHMLHDPEEFPNPDAFDPSRYNNLDSEMRKVTDLAFGFGRRACPGFYFAEGTIFAIISTVLATCDIIPAVDENGENIIPKVAYTSGSIVFPEPFKCKLVCRSPQALAMLSQIPSAPE